MLKTALGFTTCLLLLIPLAQADTIKISTSEHRSNIQNRQSNDQNYSLPAPQSTLSVDQTLQNTQNEQIENMAINHQPKLSEVSEPSTLGLMFGGLGLAGLIAYKSQKQQTE